MWDEDEGLEPWERQGYAEAIYESVDLARKAVRERRDRKRFALPALDLIVLDAPVGEELDDAA